MGAGGADETPPIWDPPSFWGPPPSPILNTAPPHPGGAFIGLHLPQCHAGDSGTNQRPPCSASPLWGGSSQQEPINARPGSETHSSGRSHASPRPSSRGHAHRAIQDPWRTPRPPPEDPKDPRGPFRALRAPFRTPLEPPKTPWVPFRTHKDPRGSPRVLFETPPPPPGPSASLLGPPKIPQVLFRTPSGPPKAPLDPSGSTRSPLGPPGPLEDPPQIPPLPPSHSSPLACWMQWRCSAPWRPEAWPHSVQA